MAHKLTYEKILHEFEPSEDEKTVLYDIQKYNGPRNNRFEPHGEGRAKFVNGGRYEGCFRKGLLHGKGRLILQDCYRYDGYWHKGMKHGMGRMYYPDCSQYDGEFRKDQRNGFGMYLYANGARYEGNWYKDHRHGVGCYTFSASDATLKGSWVHGVSKGPAELIFEDCRFHGYWDGDRPRGLGCFTFDAKVMVLGIFYVDEKDELVWQPEAIEKYKYSKLPLEPLPLPVDESDISEVSSSDDEECRSHASSIILSDEI